MFYSMANVDDFVGLGDCASSLQGLGAGKAVKIDLKNCPDLLARAQKNFNLAAKHDDNFSTYQKNMNLRYSQYQKCMTASGQTPLPIDTTADPTAVVTDTPVIVPPPSALQMTAAIAGGVLTPTGTAPTPSAVKAQQAAAASIEVPADASFLNKNTLITIGVGVAALAALIFLMKKTYPSQSGGSVATTVPGVKV